MSVGRGVKKIKTSNVRKRHASVEIHQPPRQRQRCILPQSAYGQVNCALPTTVQPPPQALIARQLVITNALI